MASKLKIFIFCVISVSAISLLYSRLNDVVLEFAKDHGAAPVHIQKEILDGKIMEIKSYVNDMVNSLKSRNNMNDTTKVKNSTEVSTKHRVTAVNRSKVVDGNTKRKVITDSLSNHTTKVTHPDEGVIKRRTSVVMPKYIHPMFDGLQTKDKDNILNVCDKILKINKFVTVQFLTAGYLDITKSWICNIQCFDLLSRVLFITTDKYVYTELHKFNPKINVALLHYDTSPSFSWGQVGYWKYMVYRTGVILFLLQNDVPVFITESDSAWMKDPFPVIEKATNFDIIGMKMRTAVCGGFTFLNCTNTTKRIWQNTFNGMEDRVIGHDNDTEPLPNNQNDQQKLNNALRKETMVRIKILEDTLFTGWAAGSPHKYDVYVMQNNYIVGNVGKILRAKRYGLWFISDDGMECIKDKCVQLMNRTIHQ